MNSLLGSPGRPGFDSVARASLCAAEVQGEGRWGVRAHCRKRRRTCKCNVVHIYKHGVIDYRRGEFTSLLLCSSPPQQSACLISGQVGWPQNRRQTRPRGSCALRARFTIDSPKGEYSQWFCDALRYVFFVLCGENARVSALITF